MNYREQAREDLHAWSRAFIEEEAQRLVEQEGINPTLAEYLVLLALEDLAKAAFEKSRAGWQT